MTQTLPTWTGGDLSWCDDKMALKHKSCQHLQMGNCHGVKRTSHNTDGWETVMVWWKHDTIQTSGKLSWCGENMVLHTHPANTDGWETVMVTMALQHKPCQHWWVGNCHGDYGTTNPANTDGWETVMVTMALQHKPCQHWWVGNCHGDYGTTTQTLPTLMGGKLSWWLWHYNTNPANTDGQETVMVTMALQTLPTLMGGKLSWWLWHYNTNPANTDGWETVMVTMALQTLPTLMGGKLSWWLWHYKPCQHSGVGNSHGDYGTTNPANTEGGETVMVTMALQTLPTLRGGKLSWWLWHYNTNPANTEGGETVMVTVALQHEPY